MRTIILCLLTTFCLSCNQNLEEKAPMVEVDMMTVPNESGAPNANEDIVNEVKFLPPEQKEDRQPRKWVKEGHIKFKTDDPEATKKQILAVVANSRGYVASDQQENDGDEISYTLIVKVPASQFDQFLATATSGVKTFDQKKISTTDVTAEYVDSEARLKSQKKIEERYLQLISKATAVKDILEIEKELGEIRTEIESKTAQLAVLTDQIDYSSLVITFYKNDTTAPTWIQQYAKAFSEGWDNAQELSFDIISWWPFMLVVGLITLMIRKLIKNRRVKDIPSE